MFATNSNDLFDLRRFVRAQEGIYEQALAEVRSGRKRTHWMWFVFPQINGLGFSPMAKKYAIKSIDEAREYLKHPVLGSRLIACSEALIVIDGQSASEIFWYPDDLKLHSSMTLFAMTVRSPGDSVFHKVLKKYFRGDLDASTVTIVKRQR